MRTRGPSDFVPFREYILCNETMVLSYSIATSDIRERLNEESALLHALRGALAHLTPAESAKSAVPAWPKLPAAAPLLTTWRAALAFDSRKYRSLPSNLDKMIAALAAYDASGDPLVHVVTPAPTPSGPQ